VAYNEYVKNLSGISKHLQMAKEFLKALSHSTIALATWGEMKENLERLLPSSKL